jgi:hypothetical protein
MEVKEGNVVCQVCDYVAQFTGEEAEEWRVSFYEGPHGRVQVLTCPRCTELPPQEIIIGFMNKIKSGKVLSLH